MESLELFRRSAEDTADLGAEQFSFRVLAELWKQEDAGTLDKSLQLNRVGRVHLTGYARNVRTQARVNIDKRSAYHVIGNSRTVLGVIRGMMRDEVANNVGMGSGVADSDWEYNTGTVTIEYKAQPKQKAVKLPPSRVFKKEKGKWVRKVKGYTRKDGKKIKGYTRKSSRAEVLRYKRG